MTAEVVSVSRAKLLVLQLLVAVAAVLLWQLFTTVPIAGVKILPPFFFSTPYDVAARMHYRGESLATAARGAMRKLSRLQADGGLIAVDRRGNIVMPFNSERMYRGAIDARGRRTIGIY